ncbi:MAG: dNTP triphosphohydrolase [Phycisphaerae bacterium]|nr:dNTP triphosphohydrolase [Phycisphaerae bacterium]
MGCELLAAYAASNASGQRKFPEQQVCEFPFQQDRNRVLRCSAFRRLDFKTQVFVPHDFDHFRTRLTHSLEVAQVSRDAGRALGLNEDLIEAVALAHDLGHAPFGHSGEDTLNELMADFDGFEHNAQSLRVVDYLEHPFADFRGLNLTNAARHCIAGHENRDGVTHSEFAGAAHPPLESQVVDICDEIAYITADLEDAMAAGWVNETMLADQPLWENAHAQAVAQYPDAREIHHRIAAVRLIPQQLSADLTATTFANIERLGVETFEDVQNAPEKCASLSRKMADDLGQLKKMLFANVYRRPDKLENDEIGASIIRELFAAFIQSPMLLPSRYLERIESKTDSLHRVTCDYIAGMTDRFAREQHAEMIG